ncbi:MAG TPA: superoxide dismutase family protein [Dongiaceae bacterium]|jgi:Cu-Zn family superoxide dismutase|nr:superoxide dismutase family protein [Dongiaceae bacterium]
MNTKLQLMAGGICLGVLLTICGCQPKNQTTTDTTSENEVNQATNSPAPSGTTNDLTTSTTTNAMMSRGGTNMNMSAPGTNTDMSAGGTNVTAAIATLAPTQGNTAVGTVTFTQEANGVHVVADVTGLSQGDHGFHIHEKGDCSAPDGASAGGHFNPTGMPHGGPDSPQHHLGDLGNITADASGHAHLDRVFSFLSLQGTNSIVGHGVIVHAGKDDFTSQPSGNAGARVACGVIEAK